MELLVRVAESGSMTVAAQQLGLTPAAVSATVGRVEEALGTRLFERTTRTLHPTDDGLVVLEGCQAVVSRWHGTLEAIHHEQATLEGTVHLSAPADTTYQLLADAVAKFGALHPRLRVVLHTSDAVAHLHRDAIDMAVRYGPLRDSTLTVRKLAEAPGVLVASPAYLEARGAPTDLDALPEHRCLTIRLSSTPVHTWTLHGPDGVRTVALQSPLCGDGYLARRWALAGEGIAFKSLFDVVDDLETGRLVHVLPEYRGDVIPIHAVFPSRRFLPIRVRALDTAISEAFADRAARCARWQPPTSAR